MQCKFTGLCLQWKESLISENEISNLNWKNNLGKKFRFRKRSVNIGKEFGRQCQITECITQSHCMS